MPPEWITAIATLVYAVFTGWIIWEIRRDRKLAHKPILKATLSRAAYPDWLLFKVKNVGKGPALDCVFACKDTDMLEWKVKGGVLPIGCGESVEFKFESDRPEKWRSGERIFLEIEYSDVFGKVDRQRVFETDSNTVILNSEPT
jgi:hypothetical protein